MWGRLLLAQALLYAGLCAARSPVELNSATGAIHVPEHLKPLHRRARSTQRIEHAGPLTMDQEASEQGLARSMRTADDIKNVTDKILHKSVCPLIRYCITFLIGLRCEKLSFGMTNEVLSIVHFWYCR